MSGKKEKNLKGLVSKAVSTGKEEDVSAALGRATEQSKEAMGAFVALALNYPKITQGYCEEATELPSVVSSDKTMNDMVLRVAELMRLGSKAKFNYSGDRKTGIVSKIAIERVVQIIEELRIEFADIPEEAIDGYGEAGEFLKRVKRVDDLTRETSAIWKGLVSDYVLFWLGASDDELTEKWSKAFPTIDLVREARPYAESRLESRKADKRKRLDEKFPKGAELNRKWQHGERAEAMDYAMELTQYQANTADIDKMQLDEDCWRYGIERLVGEKFKRLLRGR